MLKINNIFHDLIKNQILELADKRLTKESKELFKKYMNTFLGPSFNNFFKTLTL